MGNGDSRHLPYHKTEVKTILQKSDTGRLINLSPTSKEAFIKQLENKVFDSWEMAVLQPQSVGQQMGFLYKPDVFFYEGGIKNARMHGKGKITLLREHVKYQGMFQNNQMHGNGILNYGNKQLVLTGMWEHGNPKNIRFGKKQQEYTIVFHTLLSESNLENVYKGSIRYVDGRRYDGEFRYDVQKQKFLITGSGRLYYKNNDYVGGYFRDGSLQGPGQFVSTTKGSYKGEFKDGKFNGKGEYIYRDGKILEIGWKNNKPHGTGWLKINSYTLPSTYVNGVRILQKQQSDVMFET